MILILHLLNNLEIMEVDYLDFEILCLIIDNSLNVFKAYIGDFYASYSSCV